MPSLLADIRKFLNCNTATLESVLLLNCVNLEMEILSVQFKMFKVAPVSHNHAASYLFGHVQLLEHGL